MFINNKRQRRYDEYRCHPIKNENHVFCADCTMESMISDFTFHLKSQKDHENQSKLYQILTLKEWCSYVKKLDLVSPSDFLEMFSMFEFDIMKCKNYQFLSSDDVDNMIDLLDIPKIQYKEIMKNNVVSLF